MLTVPLCLGALAAAAHCAVAGQRATQPADDLTWVVGVNYVPSWVHNDIGTLIDYDEAKIEQELSWAGNGTNGAGFNSVRLFLHSLAFFDDSMNFIHVLDHFVATSAANGMRVLFVVFDSCFGDINANITWIDSGLYKNYTWIPNPGPAMVANETEWVLLDMYVNTLVDWYKDDPRVLGWDIMNEPDFAHANILNFISHYADMIQSIDTNPDHVATVGLASASQQALVQGIVRTLSFHDYDGGGFPPGNDLAGTIASQQALASSLAKAVLMTESMSRPTDTLDAVLPAVTGCYGRNKPIGFFVWELMLGVDQFNNDWSYPYQGLVYPDWAVPGKGGTWWNDSERVMLANYSRYKGAACPPLPVRNYTDIPDTDPRIAYAPPSAWTAWSGAGPRDGTLHYCNTPGCVMALELTNGTQYSMIHKIGPDCGIMDVYWDGQLVGSIDTYSATVDWGHELALPGADLDPTQPHDVTVTVTGKANPSSSNAYVQIVGFNVYWKQ